MDLPVPNDELLEKLYEWKRECAESILSAEARGALQEAGKLKLRMREIVSLIIERGGEPDA